MPTEMSTKQPVTELIQWHKAIEYFDYDIVVDWALRLLERGVETENILILSSFSKPVDAYEIAPYVSACLFDLELDEKTGEGWMHFSASWHLREIIMGNNIKYHLSELSNLSRIPDKHRLTIFQDFHYAWTDLEDGDMQWYFGEDTNLENIESKVKEEASNWLNNQSAPQSSAEKRLLPEMKQSVVPGTSDIKNDWIKHTVAKPKKWYHFFR